MATYAKPYRQDLECIGGDFVLLSYDTFQLHSAGSKKLAYKYFAMQNSLGAPSPEIDFHNYELELPASTSVFHISSLEQV